MRVSYEWLTDYIDTHTPAAELGERFLMTSSELEGVEAWSEMLANIVVGEVVTCEPHPNASKLKITTVSTGGRKKLKIVCGAPNVAAGIKVLVALPGAVVSSRDGKSTFTIAPTELRGEVSEGMLCAAEELGLQAQGDGLLILPKSAKVGTAAAKFLNRETTVLDLEITPNRPDLLSYVGLAREVATFERKALKEPSLLPFENLQNLPAAQTASSTNTHLSSRLSVIQFAVTEKAETPSWMSARLELSGIRPIHPVVDVANYVMLELGQPLHTYDSTKLPSTKAGKQEFLVGPHTGNAEFQGLDGVTRKLTTEDIVITVQGETVSLGGIMGSAGTAISSQSTGFVLEAAAFHGPAIRRTSRRLGLRTEASSRFEKGVDAELTVTAIKRAAYLYKSLSIAEPVSRLVDYSHHKRGSDKPRIHVTAEQIQGILGVHISLGEAKQILQKLGFTLLHVTKASLDCIPPSWRADVTREEDILEELVRIWGYERVPSTLPSASVKPPQENRHFVSLKRSRHAAASLGFTETVHLSFTNQRELKAVDLTDKQAVPLANPLSLEQSHLLPTHLISFLRTTAEFQATPETRLFEIGSVFSPPHIETRKLSACVRTAASPESALQEVKLLVTAILNASRVTGDVSYKGSGSSAKLLVGDTEIGSITLLPATTLEKWKIRKSRTFLYLEIGLHELFSLPHATKQFQPLPVFPKIQRDISLQVSENTDWQGIADSLSKHLTQVPKLMALSWQFQRVYRGKPLPPDTKSVTVRLTYQGLERTLTDQEVDTDLKQLTKRLINLPATIVT
ncbi:phenylalanine--tRNA ligase subunit beta [soil metagenome]